MKQIVMIGIALVSQMAWSHGDHSTPGALPLPMHGGKIGEAKQSGKHVEHGGKELELFYEVKYRGKTLDVYPYALDPEKPKSWIILNPKKDLSDLKLSIEFPRSKKKQSISPSLSEKSISAKVDAKRAYRFFLNIEAKHQSEMKVAKIQIEKK